MAIRSGIIVEVITEQDIVGVGEIAPLPQFGRDSLASAHSSLTMLAPLLHGKTLEDALAIIGPNISSQDRGVTNSRRGGGEMSASTLCGLETALLDALGKTQSVSVSQLLAPTPTHIRSRIPVNAVIGAKTLEASITQAKGAVAASFGCIKLKVGLHDAIQQEIERIAAVRETIGPTVHLRLDANEAWSLEQAMSVLSQCVQYDIQYVEQPLPASMLQDMHLLRQSVPIPLAADEAVYNLESAHDVLDHEAADVLILKLQLTGGLRVGRQIIQLAAERGVQCVVTSSIETGVGVVAALHLAAASSEITLECGLATLELLADDLIVEDVPVENGSLTVPDGPGLGIHLDKNALFSTDI